jgi:hypothetical protein
MGLTALHVIQMRVKPRMPRRDYECRDLTNGDLQVYANVIAKACEVAAYLRRET